PRDRCLRRTVASSGARPASSDTSSSEPWNVVFTPPSIGHYQTHIRGPPRLVLHPRCLGLRRFRRPPASFVIMVKWPLHWRRPHDLLLAEGMRMGAMCHAVRL